jgi:hypothetical protein
MMLASAFLLGVFASATTAQAQRIENQTAVFAALDKVTARISPLNAALNSTETFGALKVTARSCYSRAPTGGAPAAAGAAQAPQGAAEEPYRRRVRR